MRAFSDPVVIQWTREALEAAAEHERHLARLLEVQRGSAGGPQERRAVWCGRASSQAAADAEEEGEVRRGQKRDIGCEKHRRWVQKLEEATTELKVAFIT